MCILNNDRWIDWCCVEWSSLEQKQNKARHGMAKRKGYVLVLFCNFIFFIRIDICCCMKYDPFSGLTNTKTFRSIWIWFWKQKIYNNKKIKCKKKFRFFCFCIGTEMIFLFTNIVFSFDHIIFLDFWLLLFGRIVDEPETQQWASCVHISKRHSTLRKLHLCDRVCDHWTLFCE